jgi:hypothetical protein
MTFFDQVAGGAALGAAMLVGLSVAQAGYVVDLTEQGGNVVATGSGEIDLTDLTLSTSVGSKAGLNPSVPDITTGPAAITPGEAYTGFSGPSNFGGGGPTVADSGSGDSVGIVASINWLVVPMGYVSDGPLSDTATYDSATFASLGVTPGVYKWTWGTGVHADTFTLVIGTVVPESSTWAMMLLGIAGLCFVGYRRTRRGAAVTG